MEYLFAVLSLAILTQTSALSEVDQQCIERYDGTVSSDVLLGSWYMVQRFTMFGISIPSNACEQVTFSRPTAEDLTRFREKYNSPNLPYSLDDEPLLMNASWPGLVTGNKMVKFFIIDPNYPGMALTEGYSATVFKPLGDKYVMYLECRLRENTIWLMSRERLPPLEEIEALVRETPQLRRLIRQQYCAAP